MTLVPEADYPKVRALLGASTATLSNEAIAEAVLVAEDRIVLRIPTALTEVDADLVARYQRAARYITASLLATQMVGSKEDVSQFKTGDTTISIGRRKWDDVALSLERIGWEILGDPGDELPDDNASGSVFLLSRTPRENRVW